MLINKLEIHDNIRFFMRNEHKENALNTKMEIDENTNKQKSNDPISKESKDPFTKLFQMIY